VRVEGALETRSWERVVSETGYTTEVTLRSFNGLNSRPERRRRSHSPSATPPSAATASWTVRPTLTAYPMSKTTIKPGASKVATPKDISQDGEQVSKLCRRLDHPSGL